MVIVVLIRTHTKELRTVTYGALGVRLRATLAYQNGMHSNGGIKSFKTEERATILVLLTCQLKISASNQMSLTVFR